MTERTQTPDPGRDLTVAVVHFETPDVLEACLTRVRASAPGARIVVLDTGDVLDPGDAGDASDALNAGDAGAPLAASQDVERVRVANHSYAYAVNAALRMTRTPFLAFMNADVYVRPETFANLLYALRDPRAAAAGPIARDAHGTLQNQGLPYFRFQRRVLRGRPSTRAPWLSGCLQVVRMAAVRGGGGAVGGMDATLRFYNEDLEWGWRMRRSGWHCLLVATPVVHLGGNATPGQEPAFMVEGLRGGYVLSQRYKPRWFRAVHRSAVMLWAAFMEHFGDDDQREAYRTVRRMFARGHFAASPFGETLAEQNAAFWDALS